MSTVIENQDMAIEVKDDKAFSVAREAIPFHQLMEMASMLSKSTIVPISYQNRPENCFVAMDMASRMGVSVMMVMQNMYVVQGKPSWSGQAMASMVKSNPQFKNVQLTYVGKEGSDEWGAYVSAENARTGATIKGATVTIATSKKEGWYQKTGSKWQTMPELMLAYRAYAWFARVHCPELMMGLQSTEELYDVNTPEVEVLNPYATKEV